ncbi:NAD(P)-binding protein [Coniophora puteana RWD-64-598 SS2]|uniref:NAD(P)-binding protein n=1 Tax=Coniophora puteana (strain RWD-64-598) TaxID=741705 RepID=A0A5M3N164_CONPW|nr:NAD(P)-binding protein [Coniophora puteana RWD-64-598 SS2]EIW85140.1 NAD(P)-binding protein [Coniophora puteana RWD-64-598 SS2]
MSAAAQKVLVVGGNGFLGSAVCKAALARGMDVTSISSSGRPYRTPRGHSPAWTSKVNWRKADALLPETYRDLLSGVSAVVHTLGTLLEDPKYKDALARNDLLSLLGNFVSTATGHRYDPLEGSRWKEGYETINRDTALMVCKTFLESEGPSLARSPAFVYVSAEDVFRPIVPARYIETKREAEQGIQALVAKSPSLRSIYIRPSLIYHPHYRPLTSPLAALLDFSANVHAAVPKSVPTPSSILRALDALAPASPDSSLSTSSLRSMSNALIVPPIHVEHVAGAICRVIDPASDIKGVVGVGKMRELVGWSNKQESRPVFHP